MNLKKINKTLDKWIKQAESGKLWFLIIKVTRKGSYILFHINIAHYFRFENFLRYTKDYVIIDYTNFWKKNVDAIRRLNKDSTIER